MGSEFFDSGLVGAGEGERHRAEGDAEQCLAPHLSPLTAYDKKGCRCERCKTARYAYVAEYKKRARREGAPWAARERESSRAWKQRNRERNRARDRAYNQAAATPRSMAITPGQPSTETQSSKQQSP